MGEHATREVLLALPHPRPFLPPMNALPILFAVGAALTASRASASDAATSGAPPASPPCFAANTVTALSVVGPHALDVAVDGSHFRLDLDPSCAGMKAGDTIQLASLSGPVCGDGRSAAVTAGAICSVLAIRPVAAPLTREDRCFRIRDVRGFSPLRGERIAINLRGGAKRVIQVEAACPQIDRLETFDLVSGAGDGRICGHPQDAIIGRPGEAYLDGIAKQFTRNDFQPCRIMGIEVPEPEGNARR